MTCTHERIKTWLLAETHDPAGMWSCSSCGEKFMPITQALAEKHAAVRLCYELVESINGTACNEACDAISEAFPQAFADATPPKG